MPTNAPDKTATRSRAGRLNRAKGARWKNVHKHDGALVGKKQDKAGHWRTTKVPNYSTNPINAYAIDERMKQLGRSRLRRWGSSAVRTCGRS